jgi:hypothetical protein
MPPLSLTASYSSTLSLHSRAHTLKEAALTKEPPLTAVGLSLPYTYPVVEVPVGEWGRSLRPTCAQPAQLRRRAEERMRAASAE